MDLPSISTDKHICFVFQPRSGSHVLRQYIAESFGLTNLYEWFNVLLEEDEVTINDNKVSVKLNHTAEKLNLNKTEIKDRTTKQLDILNKLSALNHRSVFTMYLSSYFNFNQDAEDSIKHITAQKNIQFIKLERADVLYSILSVAVASKSNQWHNISLKKVHRTLEKFDYKIDNLNKALSLYIRNLDISNKYLKNIPTIYYEQFQLNPKKINTLFSNIPNKIISVPYNTWGGNCKDYVKNLDEVENFYEKFVNNHSEYFPQYFDKLPGINIPSFQGKQPKQLINT